MVITPLQLHLHASSVWSGHFYCLFSDTTDNVEKDGESGVTDWKIHKHTHASCGPQNADQEVLIYKRIQGKYNRPLHQWWIHEMEMP